MSFKNEVKNYDLLYDLNFTEPFHSVPDQNRFHDVYAYLHVGGMLYRIRWRLSLFHAGLPYTKLSWK